MGCCISCCVFLPPARCALNAADGPRDAMEEQQLRSSPAYREVTTKQGLIIPCFHIQTYARPNPMILLYSHGNAVDLPSVLPMLIDFSQQFEVDTLGYEYPGYGMTAADSSCSESGCIAAHEAALDYVLSELKIPSHRVILFGQSLGSGPAVDLASRMPVGGLLLFSPLLSAIRTNACDCLAATCQCLDFFGSIYKIDSVQCRTMIVHGREDEVVPFAHGFELQSMLMKPHRPLWIDGAGHNDLMVIAKQQIQSGIQDFLASCQRDGHSRFRDSATDTQQHSAGAEDGYQGKALPLF